MFGINYQLDIVLLMISDHSDTNCDNKNNFVRIIDSKSTSFLLIDFLIADDYSFTIKSKAAIFNVMVYQSIISIVLKRLHSYSIRSRRIR